MKYFTGFHQDCKMERYQLLGNERNVYQMSLYFTQTYEEISSKLYCIDMECIIMLSIL